jgi:hypothetical protein
MANRRTAAEIIQECLAAKVVEDDINSDPRWQSQRSQPKRLYQAVAKHLCNPTGETLGNMVYIASRPEQLAIFGDPRHIPSYETFRKKVRIANHRTLANPANWGNLPDSEYAIYELSFFLPEVLDEWLKTGVVSNTTSLKAAKQLRQQHPNEAVFDRRGRSERPERLKFMEEQYAEQALEDQRQFEEEAFSIRWQSLGTPAEISIEDARQQVLERRKKGKGWHRRQTIGRS